MEGFTTRNGIDIPAALNYLRTTRSFEGYEGVEFVNNQELLELECDVLVPAATENQITSQNADQLKCKVLAEGANGPTTAAADEILHQKGIFVIPDILANAGGVTVSYFEWVQDRMGYFWRGGCGQRETAGQDGRELQRSVSLCRRAPRGYQDRGIHVGDRPCGL